uniref:Uncharacterized protein n=1 Tax=Moniliophthora roreri TaxID=221103 RepID=A0A0W0FYT3_MONRR
MELEAIQEQLENEEREVNLPQVELTSLSTHQTRASSMSPQDSHPLHPLSPEPLNELSSSPTFHSLLLCPQCLTPPSPPSTMRPDSTPIIPIDEWTPPTNLNLPPSPSPPLLYQSTRTYLDPLVSVWDVEDDDKTDDRALQQSIRSRAPTPHPEARMVEVYDSLNVLCASWANTALSTAQTTVVRSAELLRLDISLETAVTDEGLVELWDVTIPMVQHLLTMIQETILTGMRNSMETGNSR